jgi:hypothetical protein
MKIGVVEAVTLTIGSVLIFADLLMNKSEKEKIKNRVKDWWGKIEKRSFTPFGKQEAEAILYWLESFTIYERNEFRFYLRYFATFFIPIAVLNLGISLYFAGGMNAPNFRWPTVDQLSHYSLLRLLNILEIWTSICTTLAFTSTIYLLVKTSKTKLLLQLLLFVIIDFVIIFAIFYLKTFSAKSLIGFITQTNYPNFFIKNRYDIQLYQTFSNCYDNLMNLQFAADRQTKSIFALSLLTIVPCLIYLGICFLFFLSKVFSPILKPVFVRPLRVLHESEKGVFTLIGAFIIVVGQIVVKWIENI